MLADHHFKQKVKLRGSSFASPELLAAEHEAWRPSCGTSVFLARTLCRPDVLAGTICRLYSTSDESGNACERAAGEQVPYLHTAGVSELYQSRGYKVCPHVHSHLGWLHLHRQVHNAQTSPDTCASCPPSAPCMLRLASYMSTLASYMPQHARRCTATSSLRICSAKWTQRPPQDLCQRRCPRSSGRTSC